MLIHERSTAERERVEYWKRAFRNLYGCRLNTVEQHLRTARPEIIEILNINANCNLLKRWDSGTDSKNQILRRCNDLVNDWLFGRSPDFLHENSPSHNAYKDVIERYRSGQCFAKGRSPFYLVLCKSSITVLRFCPVLYKARSLFYLLLCKCLTLFVCSKAWGHTGGIPEKTARSSVGELFGNLCIIPFLIGLKVIM